MNPVQRSLPQNSLVHLQQLEADVEARRQDVRGLENALLEARQRCADAEKTLASLKFSLSALSRFPTEILCHLFQCCVDGDRTGHALTMRAMPWVLSRICRAWREIVIYTPSLWRVIRIDMGERHVQNPASLVKTYLTRSQPLPISCMLNLQDSFEPHDRKVVKTIMKASKRLQDIDFDLGSRADIYTELVETHGTLRLPLLQGLRIVVSEFADGEDGEDLAPGLVPMPVCGQFSFASSLVEAHVEFPNFSLPLVLLPWEKLTELYCPFHDFGDMEEVARGARNVVNWYINFRWDDQDIHNIYAADEPVLIPHLQHLNLRGRCSILGPVLDRFVAPNLEDLALHHTYYQEIGTCHDADSIFTAIANLQTRSCCTLRRLTAPLPLFSTPLAIGLHSVEELHASLPVFNTERRLYSEAFANMKEKKLLAGMRTLHLDLQRASEARSFLVFQRFLDIASTRRRWDSSSRLERLSFWANNREVPIPLDMPSVEKLSELRKDGMVMLGDIVDGTWCSAYKNLIWKSDITKEERRSMKFLL
ncbi:hypothetical protein Moror_4261 [Moniliophthora roreri MCA 2997]|uniref:F-box domain-containing protein n=2 Tax=Moniliophthora roreri TaxID=221103 RepID=V2WUN8_MONRO|nr:hypothetical protein Moror_4261 [Moniliophthora roreri MCA 2997]